MLSNRTPIGTEGKRWVRPLRRPGDGGTRGGWQAGVWVRDRDGRRRSVRAQAATRRAALVALDRRLGERSGFTTAGLRPGMTVAELAELWLARRAARAQRPSEDELRGGRGGVASPQTVAAYQAAISHVIVPELGHVLVEEAGAGVVDDALWHVERQGRSTAHARSVLGQMFALAVRRGAMVTNPMREVEPQSRPRRRVRCLNADQARELLRLLAAHGAGHASDERGRRTGGKPRSHDVHDVVLLLLATGCRVGEVLALRWGDLDLSPGPRSGSQSQEAVPTVQVAATLVEPRQQPEQRDRRGRVLQERRVFVERLHRQPLTKTGNQRRLVLPDAAVAMLKRRRARTEWHDADDPVFATAAGGWLYPNNVRTKLRGVVDGTALEGVTPHMLRRTVGTLLAHEAGHDVARDVLGHSDPSVTFQHYVADRDVAPDVRHLLDRLMVDLSDT